MCCNGSLFTQLAITSEERDVMGDRARYGLRADGELRLLLPCPSLTDKGCSAYDIRPQGCRTFICRLVRRVRNGALSAEEAMYFVEKLQVYRRELRELCQEIMPETDWPPILVGTEQILMKKIREYEQDYRKLTAFEDQKIKSARAAYVAFVRSCFDNRFMWGLELDLPRERREERDLPPVSIDPAQTQS